MGGERPAPVSGALRGGDRAAGAGDPAGRGAVRLAAGRGRARSPPRRRPVAERDGVVTVACSSATWAHELDLLAAETLENLRRELPEGVSISALRFEAAPEPLD